jgi:hypothetical protein
MIVSLVYMAVMIHKIPSACCMVGTAEKAENVQLLSVSSTSKSLLVTLHHSSQMSVIRPFEPTDILNFNAVNADSWTATVRSFLIWPNSADKQYHTGYYSTYAAQWPEFCMTAESAHESGPSIKAYSTSPHVSS